MPVSVVRAHLLVSGLVQGVGYRYYTVLQAKRHQLTGWVKNLYSGEVEIVAEGEQGLITDFIKELRLGPRAAEVTDVAVTWLAATNEFPTFTIHD